MYRFVRRLDPGIRLQPALSSARSDVKKTTTCELKSIGFELRKTLASKFCPPVTIFARERSRVVKRQLSRSSHKRNLSFNTIRSMPVDQLWLARSKLDRGRLDECVAICDVLLTETPGDQAAWFVKCKAVIAQNYIDDVETEEESFAEVLMDENAIASVPRPGTSLNAPKANSGKAGGGGSYDQGIRPVSNSGRPMTGFARPGSSRPMSGSTGGASIVYLSVHLMHL